LNFGNVIAELKLEVGASVKVFTTESGVLPFPQVHCATVACATVKQIPNAMQIA